MIQNMNLVEDVRALARRKSKEHEYKTVMPQYVASEEEAGWEVFRRNKTSCRLRRSKTKDVLLEDRVWTLLYRMGFTHLSGHGGAILETAINDAKSKNQLDVVGLDDEVAIATECKSAAAPRRPNEFQKDLAKLASLKQVFGNATHSQFPLESNRRRIPIMCFFTWDLIISQTDRDRAKTLQIVILDENDLDYYEQLVVHLGSAAKYQFFADILSTRKVHALEIEVPALKAKMGAKYTCYSFAIRPEYLLKISYVSHRAKGKALDVDTYQRMIKKYRLQKIRKYIDENGMFPTNIVVSLAKNVGRFEPLKGGKSDEGAQYGTLHLRPAYKSAWIIDGQHRLFAYSGSPRAKDSFLSVLAFDDLPSSEQARLFIDINHEQKSVKRGLLQELFAELNWNADDDDSLLRAIISKAVQALGTQKDSPFLDRVLLADDQKTLTRCISLNALFRSLDTGRLFVVKSGIEYGPLWAGEKQATLVRTVEVVKGWFRQICEGAQEWWDLGSADGGGLAMNDGVSACIAVLRSVCDHLTGAGIPLIRLSSDELLSALRPFGAALGKHVGSFPEEERKAFRSLRGVEGQTLRRIQCQKALHDAFPTFCPEGLESALEAQAANTRQRAYAILERVERKLHQVIVEAIKEEFGEEGDLWWFGGVPDAVRKKVVIRVEEDQGRKGPKEGYFDLLDFKDIASKNWAIFEELVGKGRGGKETRLHWIEELNDLRKIVMHPSKNMIVTVGKLVELQEIESWLDSSLQMTDEDQELPSG